MSRLLALADPMMRDGDVADHDSRDVSYSQRLLSGDAVIAKGGYGSFHPGEVDGEWGTLSSTAAAAAKRALGYPASTIDGSMGDGLRGFLSGSASLPPDYQRRRAARLKASAPRALRAKIVEAANWAADHEPQIHYEQSRPIDGHGEPFKLPLRTDCSGLVTNLYEWARAPDPNGLGFSGQGYTGTLLNHLPRVSRAAVQPGDLVAFGSGTGHHVTVVIEGGDDPLLVSHGMERGPIRIRLSEEAKFQKGRVVTFLAGLS